MLKLERMDTTIVAISDQDERLQRHFQLLDDLYQKAYEAHKTNKAALTTAHASDCWLKAIVKWQDIVNSITRESHFEQSQFIKLVCMLLKLISTDCSDVFSVNEIIKSFTGLFKLIIREETLLLANLDKTKELIRILIDFTSSLDKTLHRKYFNDGLNLAFSVLSKLPNNASRYELEASMGLILSSDCVLQENFIFANYYAAFSRQQATLADHQQYILQANELIKLQEYYYLQKLWCDKHFFSRQSSIAIGNLQIEAMSNLFALLADLGDSLYRHQDFCRSLKCYRAIDALIEAKVNNLGSNPEWNEIFVKYARKSTLQRGIVEYASLKLDSSDNVLCEDLKSFDESSEAISLCYEEWQQHRLNMLKQPVLDVDLLLHDWSQATRIFIAKLCAQVQAQLGTPPCASFSVFALGSLARNEATYYSDFEWTLVWSGIQPGAIKEDIQIYFSAFTDLLRLKMQALGETHALSVNVSYVGATEIRQTMRKGLRFDEGGHYPFTSKCTFQGEMSEWIDKLKGSLIFQGQRLSDCATELQRKGDDTALYALLDATCIYGDNELADAFLKKIRDLLVTKNKAHLEVQQILAYHLVQRHSFENANPSVINIKEHILHPIQRIVAAWAMFYGLRPLNSQLRIQALVERNFIHKDLGTLLTILLRLAFSWRFQSQAISMCEQDDLLLNHNDTIFSLSHFKQQDALHYMLSTIIPEIRRIFSDWCQNVNVNPNSTIIPKEMSDWNYTCYISNIREKIAQLFSQLVLAPSLITISMLLEILQNLPEKKLSEPINTLCREDIIICLKSYLSCDWPLTQQQLCNLLCVYDTLIKPMIASQQNLLQLTVSVFNTANCQMQLEWIVDSLYVLNRHEKFIQGIFDYFILHDVDCDVDYGHHQEWAQGCSSGGDKKFYGEVAGKVHREWAYDWYKACVAKQAIYPSIKKPLESMVGQPDQYGYRLIERILQERLSSGLLELANAPSGASSQSERLPFSVKLKSSYGEVDLHPSVIAAIIDRKTGHLRHTVQQERSSQAYVHRAVAHILHRGCALHFKEHPDFPLMAYASHILNFRLCGHGSTPNEFVFFEVTWRDKKEPLYYPVLCSLTVFGDNLQDELQSGKYIKYKFNQQYLAETFMMEAVKHPGDGFPRNYMIMTCDSGEAVLVCIDLEQAFVNPFSSAGLLGRPQLREVSIVYCLPQFQVGGDMYEGLPTTALETFSKINISKVLDDCLDTIKSKEKEYEGLFEKNKEYQAVINHRTAKHPFVGKMVFAEGVLGRLAMDLHSIVSLSQRVLANRQARRSIIALLWVIKQAYPALYGKKNIIRNVWQQCVQMLEDHVTDIQPKTMLSDCSGRQVAKHYFPQQAIEPAQLLKSISNRNVTASSSEFEKYYLGPRKTFASLQQEGYGIDQARAEINCFRYENTALPDSIVGLVNIRSRNALVLDFVDVPEALQREKIERLIVSESEFLQLYLKSCTVLDDGLLSRLLSKSRDTLCVLSLQNHPKITEVSLIDLAYNFPRLKVLIANGIGARNLALSLNDYVEFNTLEALFLNHCSVLNNANISSMTIKYIEIADNPLLNYLYCWLPRGVNGRIANNIQLLRLSLSSVNIFGVMKLKNLPETCLVEIVCKVWQSNAMNLDEYNQRLILLGSSFFCQNNRKMALAGYRRALAISQQAPEIPLMVLCCLDYREDYTLWLECLNQIQETVNMKGVFLTEESLIRSIRWKDEVFSRRIEPRVAGYDSVLVCLCPELRGRGIFDDIPTNVRERVDSSVLMSLYDALKSPFLEVRKLAAEVVRVYFSEKFPGLGIESRNSLMGVAASGLLTMLECLVGQGVDLKAQDQHQRTALHYAANGGHEPVVLFLIKNGADLEAQDKEGNTPLGLAARQGHIEVVKTLKAWGASINAVRFDGQTPMMLAAANGQMAIVQNLVEQGADWKARDNNQWRVSHHAANEGHESVVSYLITNCPLEIETQLEKDSPLCIAVLQGHMGVAKILGESQGIRWQTHSKTAVEKGQLHVVMYLVRQGADWTEPDVYYRRTVLHYAAEKGQFAVVEYLVGLGADRGARDRLQQTPLHLAAKAGHEAVVRSLIESDVGLELESQDINGRTPLSLAVFEGHLEVVKILAARGARIDAIGGDGESLLMRAKEGKLAMVECLVGLGANQRARSNNQWTVLHYAACYGHEALVQFWTLYDADIELEARDIFGRTPLCLAALQGHLGVVEFLAAQGAEIDTLIGAAEVTPLMIVASRGRLPMLRCLIGLGADPRARCKMHLTSLHVAAVNGHETVVQYLLGEGVELIAQDVFGNTALHLSVHNLSMVRVLCEQGANVSQKNKFGFSVVHSAAANNHLDTLAFFESGVPALDIDRLDMFSILYHGILYHKHKLFALMKSMGEDSNILIRRGEDGYSCLECAVGFGDPEIAKCLIHFSSYEELRALNAYGFALMHLTIFRSQPAELIACLVKNGVDIDIKDQTGNSPLALALRFGISIAVRALIRYGADLAQFSGQYLSDLAIGDNADKCIALLKPIMWQLIFEDAARNKQQALSMPENVCQQIFDHCGNETLKNLSLTNRNTRDVVDKYRGYRFKKMRSEGRSVIRSESHSRGLTDQKILAEIIAGFGFFASPDAKIGDDEENGISCSIQ